MNSLLDCNALFLTSTVSPGEKRVEELRGAASAKMHLLPAYFASKNIGLNPTILSLSASDPGCINNIGFPKLCVISKINHANDKCVEEFSMAILASAAKLKSRGSEIIVIYSDNLADAPGARGTLYKDLLNLADHVVVPCNAALNSARVHTKEGTSFSTIEDPWQTKLQHFEAPKKNEQLKIAWFGNESNSIYLTNLMPSLFKTLTSYSSYQLRVICNEQALKHINKVFNSCKIKAYPWSLELHEWRDDLQPAQLEKFLKPAHIVLIPSDPNNKIKQCVSHNRMVDAIRSGCIPIASPMDSYLELRKLCLISQNPSQTINSINPHISRLCEKYSLLREDILSKFNPDRNTALWENLFKQIITKKKT